MDTRVNPKANLWELSRSRYLSCRVWTLSTLWMLLGNREDQEFLSRADCPSHLLGVAEPLCIYHIIYLQRLYSRRVLSKVCPKQRSYLCGPSFLGRKQMAAGKLRLKVCPKWHVRGPPQDV